jgi:hypothetical protein
VVEGHGYVQLKLKSGKKFIFRNVLYIPGLNKKVLCQPDYRTKFTYLSLVPSK